MPSSAARESRQTTRLCGGCRQRKAKYPAGRADRQDTPCFACFRSLLDRNHARSLVDRPAPRPPFRSPLTPRQIAHRREPCSPISRR